MRVTDPFVDSLSVASFTGKSPHHRTRATQPHTIETENDEKRHDPLTDTISPYSTVFRKNYAMLGAVFAASFAFEL